MGRLSRVAPLVAVVMLGAGWPGATALAARVTPAWGRAHPVPGLSKLNKYGSDVSSVSCASAGNCAAGGQYSPSAGEIQAFVVSEKNGAWGQAEEVPGLGALNQGHLAQVDSVSCPSAGNCAASGSYKSDSMTELAFVVNETNGVWGQAQTVTGSTSGEARVVSCASAGNCAAGGQYSPSAGEIQAFVVDETNGAWGKAETVPGLATLNRGASADTTAISCPAAGACTAVGTYTLDPQHHLVFVAGQTGGTWGTAKEQPGLAALNVGGYAGTTTVSCNAAGSCGTGGYYTDASGDAHPYVATESGGTWQNAEGIVGGAPGEGITAMSCAAAGDCSAGGSYKPTVGPWTAFVVSETNGNWGIAQDLPGQAGLGKGVDVFFSSISCSAAGDCGAGGAFDGGVYVANQKGGAWGNAQALTGLGAVQGSADSLSGISCPATGKCVGGGAYTHLSEVRAYLVNQS
jgi:hypothetical protein